MASLGEFSWDPWSIEANFIKINTFLLHMQACKVNGLETIQGHIWQKDSFVEDAQNPVGSHP